MNKNKRPYGHGTLKSQFSELEMIDELSKLILGNMSEWELSKHSRRSALEIELLNSLEVHSCPFCQSADIVKQTIPMQVMRQTVLSAYRNPS